MSFNRNGDELTIAPRSSDVVENPSSGVWEFKIEENQPIRLIKDNEFKYTFPKKMYGDVELLGDLILQRWINRVNNTGVMLSGPQGVGKSMMSQYIVNKAIKDMDAVVIKFTTAITRKDVFDFIASIKVPVIIDIDEFEKIYGWEEQMKILTYMSGGSLQGVLWLLTVNEVRRVGNYFFHRPDRIYFHIKYKNVSMDTVETIIDERLKVKKFRQDTLRAIATFSIRTYDTILSFIDEINLSKKSPEKVMSYLNIEKSEQTKGGKPKYYYRIYAEIVDGEEEVITNEYDTKALDRWCKVYDIFGEGGGLEVQRFTEVPILTRSKLYPSNPEFKLDADSYVETDNFRIQKYKIGESLTGKPVFLEFGKDPYPEPPPLEKDDTPKNGKEAIMKQFSNRDIPIPSRPELMRV